MPSNDIKKILQEWMVKMSDKTNNFVADNANVIKATAAGIVMGILLMALTMRINKTEPEYTLVKDNAVESVVSIEKGNELTLISVNRYEGGLWITTYDGKGVPESVKIESTKEIEND